MCLCRFFRVLHRIHEGPRLGIRNLHLSLENVLEGNFPAVPLSRGLIVLLQFSPLKRSANERAFAA
jgi:hypothetical protein